ncbi:MAG: DUF4249 family protein, partial [Bacteroidota bacterium]
SPDKFGNTILVDDALFDGQEQTIDILLDFFYDYVGEDEDPQFYYTVRNTSEAYYDFVRAKKIHQYNSGDPFAEPIPVNGNVENGFGVFAGYRPFIGRVEQ